MKRKPGGECLVRIPGLHAVVGENGFSCILGAIVSSPCLLLRGVRHKYFFLHLSVCCHQLCFWSSKLIHLCIHSLCDFFFIDLFVYYMLVMGLASRLGKYLLQALAKIIV
jgi:hypothetical protein